MKKLLFLVFLIGLMGCGNESPTAPKPKSPSLIDQVIRKFGMDGKWCFTDAKGKSCISQFGQEEEAKRRMPIKIGDAVDLDKPLYLCLETNGVLDECSVYEPTLASIECNFPPGESSGSCFCDGEASCSKMAAACPSGSCGDCEQGQCCGTGCEGPIDPGPFD